MQETFLSRSPSGYLGRAWGIHHQVNLTNIIVNSTVHNQFITLVSCHDQIWEIFADHNKR